MVAGMFGGLFFAVWIWLGFSLADKLRDFHWDRAGLDGPEIVAGFWFISSIAYLIAAIDTITSCGSLGDLLLTWGLYSVAGSLMLVAFMGLIFLILFGTLVVVEATTRTFPGVGDISEDVCELAMTRKFWFIIIGLFILVCGWLGSFPNPACEAMTVDSEIVEIREVLSEHGTPDQVEYFNRLVVKE